MTAGMNQSVQLPREMMIALGDYKSALKDTKQELKDLEKEAKRIEKSGGIVSKEMQQRLASVRGERNRLEDIIGQQKIDQSNASKAMQARGMVRQAITDPIGYAGRAAVDRFGQSRLGQSVLGTAGRISSRVGQSLATRGALGVSRLAGLGVSALAIGATKKVFDAKIEVERLRKVAAEGTIQTQQVMFDLFKGVSAGGATAQDLSAITLAAKKAGEQAKNVINNQSLWSFVGSSIYGYTEAGLAIEDKVAQNNVRRAVMAKKFGAGYGDAINWQNVKRKRRVQYSAEMYKEMGIINTAVNRLGDMLGGDIDSFVDVGRIPLVGGLIAGNQMEAAEIKARENLLTHEEEKWMKDRGQKLERFNMLKAAEERALAHERSNAINALEKDRLMRGLTWSF